MVYELNGRVYVVSENDNHFFVTLSSGQSTIGLSGGISCPLGKSPFGRIKLFAPNPETLKSPIPLYGV
jgi:hypothetical protein